MALPLVSLVSCLEAVMGLTTACIGILESGTEGAETALISHAGGCLPPSTVTRFASNRSPALRLVDQLRRKRKEIIFAK